MAMHELTLEKLMEDLDGGRVGVAFQQQIKRVVNDMADRPRDEKERKVTLEFKAVPVMDDQGFLDEVKGKFHVTSSVPKLRSKEYSFGFRKSKTGPMLVFNDLSDDDVNQKTIE